jgi:hypothetical protein
MTKEGEVIPIKDLLGNTLHLGSLVHFRPPQGHTWVGKILEYNQGGILVAKDRGIPARLRIVFDITLSLVPGSTQIADLIRVVNPESENIVGRVLDEPVQ